MHLDFHIYPIIDFDLLIGCPLEKPLQEKASQGSLNKLGSEPLALPTCPEIPRSKPHPKDDSFEEVMISWFGSPKPIAHLHKAKQHSSSSLEPKWSDRVQCFSEAVWNCSPSTITSCSIKGITIEAHFNPSMEVNILLWHLAYTLLGGVILEPSDKLLRSCPHGHILKCRGVAKAVPITIDKVNVHLDLHIFDILDFDLFLGYPIKQIVDASQGSLEAKLREITFAATTTCLENQMAMSFPKQNPSEKEIHPSPSSVEFETLSVGPESFILDFGQNPSMISHDESPEMEIPRPQN